MKTVLISYEEEKNEDIIKENEWIHAPREWVFKGITDSEYINEWGGGPSKFHLKAGGKYHLWDGEIYGLVLDFVENEKIVMTLREKDWKPDWKDSIVVIELSDERSGTRLKLSHSQFPDKKIKKKHEYGWGEYYLGPLKAYLENLYFAQQVQKKEKIKKKS
ncbi:MAG: SRPBCC domain-containing protein [Leptospiraceae bacterium]|nr:SRPBCC domain-containing protein [Leptospiraceae bacterium]MDW7975894.1 SRPBCC domain-containing protein [Leptospiraceae bacterium]